MLSQTRQNFYPRPPRGGRQRVVAGACLGLDISIHALREEGDGAIHGGETFQWNFYPRPPRGGRHAPSGSVPFSAEFLSTPSARRATAIKVTSGYRCVFLSTPSARRATEVGGLKLNEELFLSTPSARRATSQMAQELGYNEISIHALREEGDRLRAMPAPTRRKFLSTPSARRATRIF